MTDGQKPIDAQATDAVGQASTDPHSAGADEQLHALLGHYARLLWDLQKERIQVGNRVSAMERDELGEEWTAIHQETLTILKKQEAAVNRELERLAKRHIMADWVLATRGLGLPGFARIVGVTGSFERFATVSKVWKYLGLAVVNGEAPKKRRGEKLDYSPQGRVVCFQISESIVKLGGPYRELYDRKKAQYEEREDWPQIRRHRAAMRYAVKALIKDMWIEWHRRAKRGVIPNSGMPAEMAS